MTFPVRMRSACRLNPLYLGAVRWQFASLLLALLAVETVAQPLEWSPQRGGRTTTLEELASEPAKKLGPQALLIRNPDTSGGTAEFALADEFGLVRRFIEASPGVDLESYVGQRVHVRSDTGETLLASQLELPSIPNAPPTGVVTASHEVVQPLKTTARVAQVPPITIEGHGAFSGAPIVEPSCSCPQCAVSHSGPPLMGGFLTPYEGCSNCTPDYPCACQPSGPSCCRGSRGRFYGRAEYLLWWFDGMHVPPLVTGSPANTPQAQAGVLGQPDTEILFGNGEILSGSRDGVRFMLGMWINDYQDIGIEGDLLFFGTESTGFSATGVQGAPILARPFFNMVPIDAEGDILPPAEDAELVSFPGLVEGTVRVNARSEFSGAGLRLRAAMCCQELGSGCNSCNPCAPAAPPWGVSRIDIIGGYRYLQLDERVLIREDLTSLQTNNLGTFDIFDRFDTSNKFHGADVGFIWEWETAKWSFEFLSKVAIGNTNQRVNIRGQTTVSNNGASFTNDGGLLALRSNIGTYQRDVFSMVPELGVTLGYRITPRLRATVGYTLLYWSRVVRPGDHIDL
ncbi:MAG: BBP7 family outer membrane beta-barrel protein, partial [Aeoliella sp.]